jgi:lipopolysaccharide biosynthesis regulator YciM
LASTLLLQQKRTSALESMDALVAAYAKRGNIDRAIRIASFLFTKTHKTNARRKLNDRGADTDASRKSQPYRSLDDLRSSV